MAVNINVPSQVKTYANLAAFPASGSLKTIYIAEDTNKTYRWTGSVYTEISASAAMTWGAIGGTLSNQTDLQSALNAKQDSLGFTPVPTTRTLTINGVTQDLSADRTFTISTGITIGTTAIASGSVGRILFEGAGNVVQESSSLFWDATNNRLGIGTSSPTQSLSIQTGAIFGNTSFGGGLVTTFDGTSISMVRGGCTTTISSGFGGVASIGTVSNAPFRLFTNNSSRIQINDNGNVLINTTTDAGFRLDVNGTARVQGALSVSTGGVSVSGGSTFADTTTFSSATAGIRCSIITPLINQNISISAAWADSSNVTISTITNKPQVLIVQPTANLTLTSGTHDTQRILHTFAPTSGTAVINALTLNQTINQTGGANGITRGLYINPTLTAAADFRAIETTAGRVIFGGLPTSSAGLPTGAIWNDAGTLKIV